METIPLLVNGKIDRQALLKSYENSNNNGKYTLKKKWCDYHLITYQIISIVCLPKTYIYNKYFLDECTTQAEIDYSGIPKKQMEAATALLDTVASVLNRSARSVINIDANFYEIGGNSLNSIVTITKLNERGYYISKQSLTYY